MSNTNVNKLAIARRFENEILRDARSPVFLEYCRIVHGVDRFQYNSLTNRHFDLLLQSLALSPGDTFLDVGCAAGTMTTEVARRTGASGVGIDFARGAIDLAAETAPRDVEVAFQLGDIDDLNLPPATFNAVVAIDSLYFATDLNKTVHDLLALLVPGGRLVAFFSSFQYPGCDADALLPDHTPLARAVQANNALLQTVDLSFDDREHWKRAVLATERLKPLWEQHGQLDAWEARQQENDEIVPLVEAGRSARFLYVVTNDLKIPAAG